MKLIGTMLARNEDWVLGLSARVALTWCDELVIFNHASTDDTGGICEELRQEYPGRVAPLESSDEGWPEMQHRQRMLERARERGATHIAVIDADEILTGNVDREHLRLEISSHDAIQLPIFNLRGSIWSYHSSGIWGDRWAFTAFRDRAAAKWYGDKFHAREPAKFQCARPMQHSHGGILHLWGVSERRLRAKHALYKITERLKWPHKPLGEIERMYNWAIYGRPAWDDTPMEWRFADTPVAWWEPYDDWMKYLDVDRVPWQEAEVRRLIDLHGANRFGGLDLFGVNLVSA